MFYNFEKNIMDMTFEEILRLRDMAEQTSVQFKERLTKESKSEVAAEMVAMSNTRGGKIIIVLMIRQDVLIHCRMRRLKILQNCWEILLLRM